MVSKPQEAGGWGERVIASEETNPVDTLREQISIAQAIQFAVLCY